MSWLRWPELTSFRTLRWRTPSPRSGGSESITAAQIIPAGDLSPLMTRLLRALIFPSPYRHSLPLSRSLRLSSALSLQLKARHQRLHNEKESWGGSESASVADNSEAKGLNKEMKLSFMPKHVAIRSFKVCHRSKWQQKWYRSIE